MGRCVLDHEVDSEEAKGTTFAFGPMDEYGAVFLFGLFDEADDCVDDVLIGDVLEVVFCPVEGEEGHAFDCAVVGTVFSCAIDDVADLIEGQPFNVLSAWLRT